MNTRYRELKDREPNLSELEKEELDLLEKLQTVVDKQNAEKVEHTKEELTKQAAAGDQAALNELHRLELLERDRETLTDVDAKVAKQREDNEREAKRSDDKAKDQEDPATDKVAPKSNASGPTGYRA